MGKKKMKLLPFSSSWSWPSCQQQPRTLSFRHTDPLFKTINSAFIGSEIESPSFSTASENSAAVYGDDGNNDTAVDSIENVIKGLRSERLFFEPGESNSILEEAKSSSSVFQLKQSTLFLSLESVDPYKDFRKSMEEMVEAHGLKDWDGLQELLTWYLKVNSRSNHGYIFGAFVDLLVEVASASASASASACTSSSHSPSSPLYSYTCSSSSSSTPCVSSSLEEIHCLSSLLEIEEIRDKEDGV